MRLSFIYSCFEESEGAAGSYRLQFSLSASICRLCTMCPELAVVANTQQHCVGMFLGDESSHIAAHTEVSLVLCGLSRQGIANATNIMASPKHRQPPHQEPKKEDFCLRPLKIPLV